MILTLIRFLHNSHFPQSKVMGWMIIGFITLVLGTHTGHAETQPVAIPESQTCVTPQPSSAIQIQFEKLKQELESGFSKGLPAQLQEKLIGIRGVNDEIALRMMETKHAKPQEIQEVLKMTISHIEKFVAVIPQLAEQAPKVRDQYVLPLSNLDLPKPTCSTEPNIHQTVFKEIERINANLYSVQGLTPQKYINFQEDLQVLLNLSVSDHNPKIALDFEKKLPEVINSMQLEVDRALPSFQLSAQYKSSGF